MMKARLVYFKQWMNPIRPEILTKADTFELKELPFADDPEVNWQAFENAHGYQALPSFK